MGKDAVASSGSGKKCKIKNNFQEARRCLSARDKLTATIDERWDRTSCPKLGAKFKLCF